MKQLEADLKELEASLNEIRIEILESEKIHEEATKAPLKRVLSKFLSLCFRFKNS